MHASDDTRTVTLTEIHDKYYEIDFSNNERSISEPEIFFNINSSSSVAKMFQKTLNRVFRCIPLLKYHINVDKALKIVPNRFYSRENYFKNANKIILYANVPPFLAFFRKKEEEGEKEAGMSFLEKILPDDIYLLIRKLPKQDESTPEGKLVTTMKRTILCIQRGQYEKAEQMGHFALRMAQDMQHYDGITLVYDVLANLAHETGQHKKAESLYVSVLQRLLMKNVPPDDIRVWPTGSEFFPQAILEVVIIFYRFHFLDPSFEFESSPSSGISGKIRRSKNKLYLDYE